MFYKKFHGPSRSIKDHSLSALARRFLPFQTACGDASSYKRLTALRHSSSSEQLLLPTQESSLDYHTLHTLFEMIPQMSRQAMRPAFRAIQRRTLMGGHPTGPTYSEESLVSSLRFSLSRSRSSSAFFLLSALCLSRSRTRRCSLPPWSPSSASASLASPLSPGHGLGTSASVPS